MLSNGRSCAGLLSARTGSSFGDAGEDHLWHRADLFFFETKQEGIKPLLQYIEKTNKGTGTGGKKKMEEQKKKGGSEIINQFKRCTHS
jgi:hypothetical protein